MNHLKMSSSQSRIIQKPGLSRMCMIHKSSSFYRRTDGRSSLEKYSSNLASSHAIVFLMFYARVRASIRPSVRPGVHYAGRRALVLRLSTLKPARPIPGWSCVLVIHQYESIMQLYISPDWTDGRTDDQPTS